VRIRGHVQFVRRNSAQIDKKRPDALPTYVVNHAATGRLAQRRSKDRKSDSTHAAKTELICGGMSVRVCSLPDPKLTSHSNSFAGCLLLSKQVIDLPPGWTDVDGLLLCKECNRQDRRDDSVRSELLPAIPFYVPAQADKDRY